MGWRGGAEGMGRSEIGFLESCEVVVLEQV